MDSFVDFIGTTHIFLSTYIFSNLAVSHVFRASMFLICISQSYLFRSNLTKLCSSFTIYLSTVLHSDELYGTDIVNFSEKLLRFQIKQLQNSNNNKQLG
jgi:site-specific recombinase